VRPTPLGASSPLRPSKAMAAKPIVVTGGNDGIGLALCKQLVLEHGCRVFLGSRSVEKGEAAVQGIRAAAPADCTGSVELAQVDVGDDASVAAAAAAVKASLGDGGMLYAIVNNAGIGNSGAPAEVMNTNFKGPKRMIDAFGPLLSSSEGRVVNVGSGVGPGYVKGCPPEMQVLLSREPDCWDQIGSFAQLSEDGTTGLGSGADTMSGYGLSKALLSSYTMLLAKEHPEWKSSCCSPGFISTKLTRGWGDGKSPEDGTLAIKHCLFDELEGNGWYYGSDGVRSPYHFMRNPGEPVYDGSPPH